LIKLLTLILKYQHALISVNREEIRRREDSVSSIQDDSSRKEERIMSLSKRPNQMKSSLSVSNVKSDKWGGIEQEQILALRSQSQRSLVHTISHDDEVSTGGMSKASKSSKKKRKERRNSNPGVSTTATAAAIEAVAKAMEESGGDISRAVAVLMQQQQEQKLQLQVKRKQKKIENRDKSQCDEYSISVMSEGTSSSSKSRSKKKKKSARNIGLNNDDDEHSVNSGRSNQGSVNSTSSRGRKCFGLEENDDVSVRSNTSRRKSNLQPIEEEVVIRGGSHSSSRSGSVKTRGSRRQEFSPAYDDVDSDGEPFGPPAVFCFWVKPQVSKPKRIIDAPTNALIASQKSSKTACTIM
jgi:hypothetical protein